MLMPIAVPEKRKAQIRRHATVLFQDRGFAATSMRDLAAALGVEAASLYSHISSKQELLAEICFRLADALFAAFDEAEHTAASPTEALQRFINGHVRVLLDDPAAAQVFLTEWRHLTEPLLSDFTARREQYEGRLRTLLRRGADAGELHLPANDERFAALWLLSGLNWLPGWYKPAGKLDAADIAKRLSMTFLHGLGT
jgi:TetR/AcrR family transcriptional regulator, cholesterol catabolism regulator